MGKRRFTDEEEELIAKKYQKERCTVISLAKSHRCMSKTINNALRRQNVIIRGNRKFADTEEIMISHIYNQGYSPQRIATSYNTSKVSITNSLKRQGVTLRPNRVHFFNEQAFDNLNNEHALYWLGFVYADGNVTRYELRIGLSIKDLAHVRLLRLFMNSNAKIRLRPNAANVGFASRKLVKRLLSIGIVVGRNQFYKLKPYIPPNLIHHFIRGYLDGDGCISTNEQVVFLGQPDILEFIRDELNQSVGASLNTIRQRRGICEISWGGINQANKIAEYLYHNATIWLDRKRKIAENWRK